MLRMKAIRLARGWSQPVLAVAAKVGVGDVSRIETGRLVPYPGQAVRLAKVLGCEVGELQEEVGGAEDGGTSNATAHSG